MQRRVALEPVDRVAFEVWLVEEDIDDLVCFYFVGVLAQPDFHGGDDSSFEEQAGGVN